MFACLWVGRRDETQFLHWAGGSLIDAAAIPSFNHLAQTPFQIGLLHAGLSLSTLAVLTGVRRFDGCSPIRPRMLVTILAFGPDSAASRICGDEFVLLVSERSPAEARWLADEIRHAVARTDSLPAWTISLGIAAVEPGEADFFAAIERADRSLYRAKAQGRDRAAA